MSDPVARTRSPLEVEAESGSESRVVAFWEGGFASAPLPDRGEITIGRGESADLRIDHATVSREHARLILADEVSIRDLGSSNGTRVGGQNVAANTERRIGPGDLVEVGSAFLTLHRASERDKASGRDRDLVARVAASELSVLFLGETGVGKQLAAHRLHCLSRRAKGPLVELNCAALSESLLDSELFGHERGAFTGAVAAKQGLLEAGNGGSVFLDEVGELPANVQAKLLKAIEDRTIRRVGSVTPRSIDVRFIAATNRPIEQMVAAGTFRRDLYFRLAGMTIRLLPLRQRLEELPRLCDDLVQAACQREGRSVARLSNRALARLRQHSFPGNVRELKNVLERAIVLCDGARIEPEHLVFDSAELAPHAPADSDEELMGIREALERAGGNQTRAAEMLGISRRTLVNRLNRYALPRPLKDRDRGE
jgi:transcriptional regulator with PAS, ATPase and Fis domain